jgi:hypothetical protein
MKNLLEDLLFSDYIPEVWIRKNRCNH